MRVKSEELKKAKASISEETIRENLEVVTAVRAALRVLKNTPKFWKEIYPHNEDLGEVICADIWMTAVNVESLLKERVGACKYHFKDMVMDVYQEQSFRFSRIASPEIILNSLQVLSLAQDGELKPHPYLHPYLHWWRTSAKKLGLV